MYHATTGRAARLRRTRVFFFFFPRQYLRRTLDNRNARESVIGNDENRINENAILQR